MSSSNCITLDLFSQAIKKIIDVEGLTPTLFAFRRGDRLLHVRASTLPLPSAQVTGTRSGKVLVDILTGNNTWVHKVSIFDAESNAMLASRTFAGQAQDLQDLERWLIFQILTIDAT